MKFVWQLSVIQFNNNKTLVTGTVLHKKPGLLKPGASALRQMLIIAGSYFLKPFENGEIVVQTNAGKKVVETNRQGFFQVEFDGKMDEIEILSEKGKLRILQSYRVLHKVSKSAFSVISDVDDTIIYSYTRGHLKRVFTVLLKPLKKRKAVPFTQQILQSFQNEVPEVFYVSRSESNLFSLLTQIIAMQGFPEGPVFLTPFRRIKDLFQTKPTDFKLNTISQIINNSENKSFLLFGDDAQKDMEVYTRIIEAFPGRIKQVFIRQTNNKINARQKTQWEKLNSTGVEAEYFIDNVERYKTELQ